MGVKFKYNLRINCLPLIIIDWKNIQKNYNKIFNTHSQNQVFQYLKHLLRIPTRNLFEEIKNKI